MEKVYLSYSGLMTARGHVRVNVFVKDVDNEHVISLKHFLKNQNIEVVDFKIQDRSTMSEFPFFSDGFEIQFKAHRWSFFKMRDYIRTYIDSWDTQTSLCTNYLKNLNTKNDSVPVFDDRFYVNLSRLIDQCEDNYYLGDRSIGLFINSVLKIFRDSLQLYWACAALEDRITGDLTYINYIPASISKSTILKDCARESKEEILSFPVTFHDDPIAQFHLHLSPYSPSKEIVEHFAKYVLAHIDDFIYGDRLLKQETFLLKAYIADLEKQLPNGTNPEHPEAIDKIDYDPTTTRLLLIGEGRNLNTEKIQCVFKKSGFVKKNVEMITEYEKVKKFDINNLKKERSRYDGIILGPMPHNVKGDMDGSSLIAIMERSPDEYPPFEVARERSGTLHISKNALEICVKKLAVQLEQVNSYAD